MRDLWIVECRDTTGALDFVAPQPESVFGLASITGMTEDAMASVVFRHAPDASLRGDNMQLWPTFVDPRWTARRKTW